MKETGQIKIEKGVPMPETGSRYNYPFNEMKVGDSIVVPGDQSYSCISAICYYSKRHPGTKFSTRKQLDGTRRIWRTE